MRPALACGVFRETAAEETQVNDHAPLTSQPPQFRERCVRVCTQRPSSASMASSWADAVALSRPGREPRSAAGRTRTFRPGRGPQVHLQTFAFAGFADRGVADLRSPERSAPCHATAVIIVRNYRGVTRC